MLNIFNLFLFLLMLWILFMVSAGNISWLYIIFGIFASASVSILSYNLKLIEAESELLYLSFGFYRHFLKTYCSNFFSALKLIINMAWNGQSIRPVIYTVHVNYNNKFNPALLITTFNMTTGLLCMGLKDNDFIIHAISEEYFDRFDLHKITHGLREVNDDNLI